MSTQELLTYLFNAIALGFTIIAVMDFTSRLIVLYKQVSSAPSLSKTEPTQPLPIQPPLVVALPQPILPLPDPWLLPLTMLVETPATVPVDKQPILRLLPPAKESFVESSLPVSEEILAAVDLSKLKLRQARKIAKVLGIAQKVNGRDQRLAFLISQIKFKLQQAKPEILQVVKQELLAS